MSRPQPTLQAAVVTGLNLLNDPDVRIPAAQADGVVALRTLLQALASGQLVVSEAQVLPTPELQPAKVRAPRAPRRTKAQMLAAANGAAVPTTVAAPATTQ